MTVNLLTPEEARVEALKRGKTTQAQKTIQRQLAYEISPECCPECDVALPYRSGKKFCSRTCAATFYNRDRKLPTPKHQTKRGKNAVGPYSKLFGYHPCNCCASIFLAKTPAQVTCSPECARKNQTYRKIVHLYPHNGEILKLESSWEVKIAQHLDNLSITWTRPKHIPWIDSAGKPRKYFPDFYLPGYDLYLDPKNQYQISISQEKLTTISMKVNLLYGAVDFIKLQLAQWLARKDSNLHFLAPKTSDQPLTHTPKNTGSAGRDRTSDYLTVTG